MSYGHIMFMYNENMGTAMLTDGSYDGSFLRHLRLVRQCVISALFVSLLTDKADITHCRI